MTLRRAHTALPLGALVAALVAPGPASALTILADFGTSITGASNAAQVEGAINAAIANIEAQFSTPGSISIYFGQAAGSFLGQSQTTDSFLTYNSYKNYLTAASAAQPSNTVLASAVANLSSGNNANGSKLVAVTSADAKLALGLSSTGCFDSTGSFVNGCGQTNFGVITLSTTYTLNFGTTAVPGLYSAINVMEHEIFEILGGGGQGTMLNAVAANFSPFNAAVGTLDFYRYSAPGTPSFTTSGSATSYFSVDGGVTNIIGFNQNSGGDYADWVTNRPVAKICP